MTTDQQAQLDRIERDRRKRERLLLALLLLFMDKGTSLARQSIRSGADPVLNATAAIRGASSGVPHIHWRGLAERLTPLAVETFHAGQVRAALLAGIKPHVDESDVPQAVVKAAEDLADKTAAAVGRVVTATVAEAEGLGLNAAKSAQLLNEAMRAAGMDRDNPAAADAASERLVVSVYGWGMKDRFEHKDMLGRVTGYQYIATLDSRTTPICRTYHGTMLPTFDPWWRTHWPSNHWRCRSIVMPLFKKFQATEFPPLYPSPMPGFGIAPLIRFGSLVGV